MAPQSFWNLRQLLDHYHRRPGGAHGRIETDVVVQVQRVGDGHR
jgi:hypothetical protein